MHLVTRNTPAPQPGTVLHLLYLSEDQQLSERLVRLISADATHWKGFDLLKQGFRSFRRDRLYWAKPITDPEEESDLFFRLTVHRLHAEQLNK